MRNLHSVLFGTILGLSVCSLIPAGLPAQSQPVPARITQAINNTRLTMLRGNTHPMAQAQYDRGAAPASLAMDHMQLVLTRSAAQTTALNNLLAEQQDRTSPNYHKWLTPEQFGEQFGVSDQDIQTITSWLQSQGFQVDEVANGRNIIEFSGNAGQVQAAFHAAIHRYVLPNGEEHWANASDPEIPAALASVVAGVNTLNNFRKKPASHSVGTFQRNRATGKVTRISPEFTFAGGCNNTTTSTTNTNCYAIGPGDFGTIYNVTPLWNSGITGSGQTIGIVSDSNINLNDVSQFRSLFGLSTNTPTVTLNGANPGIIPCANGGNECEAVLDVEWAGAVAPGAKINLVVSPSSNTAFGGDLSAEYIVNNSSSFSILSYSYGACELALGTSGNQMYDNLWSQAASEGLTVVVSTGDNGAAGCDNVGTVPQSGSGSAQPAEYGLAVNGLASTPYDVAVGGTDFNDLTNVTTYFSTTSGTLSSAKSYIPEVVYNDTCTNPVVYNAEFSFSSAEPACNSATLAEDSYVLVAGGNGGASNCTTNATNSSAQGPVSSCSGGYAKPTWQTGVGVPSDGVRDLPDVSLFAGDGAFQNFYVVCEEDTNTSTNLNGAPCNLSTPYENFGGVGGTSVSAQAFAGIMALIDQQANGKQGLANPNFYRLAAAQSPANCNSSGTVAGSCIFNDVTSGTNAMPCAQGSPNCGIMTSGDAYGVLTGYAAGTGYDQATGLGSFNACNLVEDWGGGKASFVIGTSTCPASLSISSAGASNTAQVTVTGINGFAGTVTFSCSGLPTGATCTFNPATVALSATTTSATTTVTVATTTASFLGPSQWIGPLVSGHRVYIMAMLGACGLALTVWMILAKPRRAGVALAGLVVIGLLTIAAGCGGGSNSSSTGTTGVGGTGSNTTNATITASSPGAQSQTVTFAVTIQ